MGFHNQLRLMIQLSLVDNKLSNVEKRLIYALGKANRIPEKDIDALFEELMSKKHQENLPLDVLTEEDKLDYLYNLIQLMKVDKKIYLSEIRFCEDLASRLGFKKKVITELSSRIHSELGMGADREVLLKIINKYKVDS